MGSDMAPSIMRCIYADGRADSCHASRDEVLAALRSEWPDLMPVVVAFASPLVLYVFDREGGVAVACLYSESDDPASLDRERETIHNWLSGLSRRPLE